MSALAQNRQSAGGEHIRCYNQAGLASTGGRHEEALTWYDRAIALKPDFAEAHNNRGLLLAGLGRHEEAIVSFRRALEARPMYGRALNNLGLSHKAQGDAAQALECFDAALRLQPDYFPALANRAEAQLELGRHAQALEGYERALRLQPDHWKLLLGRARARRGLDQPAAEHFAQAAEALRRMRGTGKAADADSDLALAEALQGADRAEEALQHLERIAAGGSNSEVQAALGAALLRAGAHARAHAAFEQALRQDAGNVEALRGSAALKQLDGDSAAALAFYDRALAQQPKRAELHFQKGDLLQKLTRHEAATDCFLTAAALRPGYKDALMACSASFSALRRFEPAVGCVDEVLKFDPQCVPALVNRGAFIAELGDQAGAIAQYDRALAIDPHAYPALCNRGTAAIVENRPRIAIESFTRALEVAASRELPAEETATIRSRLLDAKASACDWADYASLRAGTIAAMAEGLALSSFAAFTFADDPALQLAVAERHAALHYPAVEPGLAPRRRPAHERIRVAYLSADFHDHATAYLMAGLFERHDRSRFEVTLVSFGPDDPNSRWRRRIRAAAERFIDAAALTDEAIAARLAELEIDIAVDLKGYTLACRTGIFARRPAPVQVNYLGFPGTMGAPYIDYLLADGAIIPVGDERHYSEKVVRLPGCYQVNDDRRPLPGVAPSRHSLGLPEDAVVFCSFNASYKITPEMFAVWMRILARSPGSVLWQLAHDPLVEDNLRCEAARHGVDPQRLSFARSLPIAEHLTRIGCADLFLDTLPVNAHTTAADALWAGVPVLTQRGRGFAARVCSSLLQAVDLGGLVADCATDYEELAVTLANDRERLAALRARLMLGRTHAPLFDTARTTRHIEAAYAAMYQRHQAGLAPDHIAIQPHHPS